MTSASGRIEGAPARGKGLALTAAALAAIGCAGPAAGQTLSVDVSPAIAPDIGSIASSASGDTVFRISPAGAVSRYSGAGVRVTPGAVNTPTVTVRCQDAGRHNTCAGKTVYVRIGQGAATLPARTLRNFKVAMGSASLSGTVSGSGGNPINFRLNAIPDGASRTFSLGMDLPLAPSGTQVGDASAAYYVWVGFTSPNGAISDSGEARAGTLRPLSLSKVSDLRFGRVVRPLSGAGGVLKISSNGSRQATGGAKVLSSTFSAAAYTAHGEGGRTLAVDVPASFTMRNSRGDTLAVTTNTSAIGLIGLSGGAGQAGAYTFYVGGAFPITPTTRSGAYSGTFPVTVSYN